VGHEGIGHYTSAKGALDLNFGKNWMWEIPR